MRRFFFNIPCAMIILEKKRKNREKPLTTPDLSCIMGESTREWRNWQTRTFEGRVVYTVRVQVPFLAPTEKAGQLVCFFCW